MEQVCVRTLSATTDSSAQLMQLSEAEKVGAFDDECVDSGHVDATFDDGCAHQHVMATFPEIDDDFLELRLIHLSVGNDDARLGNKFAQLLRSIFD